MRPTTSPPSCAECHEIWEPKPPGTLWATPGLLRDSFTFYQCESEMSSAKLEKFQITEILTAQRGLSFKGRTEMFLCSYRAF